MRRAIISLRAYIICLGFMMAAISSPSQAENLLDVYQQAVANDPSFKQAEADFFAAEQQLPLAKAALLPNISADAGIFLNNQQFTTDAAFFRNGSFVSTGVTLNLYQPVFNWKIWKSIAYAEASIKAATANYYFAQQDLITRTVRAYLNVLQANDILRFTRANKAALAQAYDTAKKKFDVGLVAITDVYEAQARYDQASAQELANMNALENTQETLHQITNHYYNVLDGLSDKGIPLATPLPNNIDEWSQTASKQNYQLQAQHFVVLAAKENIGIQFAGHLPSVAIQGSFSDQRLFNRTLTFTDPAQTENIIQQSTGVGLVATLPIYSGGSVVTHTRQARYQYASASALEEVVYRRVVAQTRQAFLGVVSNTAQIKADAQSIISAKNALVSATTGYQVGTRILLDLLNDTTQLYQSQQQHALDQYSYMNNYVALKQAAGILNNEDLISLCHWLNKPLNLKAAQSINPDSKTKEPRQEGDEKLTTAPNGPEPK